MNVYIFKYLNNSLLYERKGKKCFDVFMHSLYLHILLIFIFLLCLGTLFLNSSSFVNAQTAPKWYLFIYCFAAILMTFSLCSIFSDIKKLQLADFALPLYLIITMLCAIQALYGIAQYIRLIPTLSHHKVNGSFDNPAGFAACICVGFPFFFYFLAKKELCIRCVSISGMIAVELAVLLSGSRAGMLALAVVCLAGFFHLFRINAKKKVFIGIFLVILSAGLYFMKKDSANGRLLIWQCSWEMIKDKPFTGHGTDGFKAEYMNYQARYFEKNHDSKYAMLADNINHPFNEYIGLLVNYGLAGFLLLLLFSFFLFKAFMRNPKKTLFSYCASWCLIAIAIFSFFSYPLRYPFVWVMGLISCSIILFQGNELRLILFKKPFFPVLALLLIPVICIKSYNRFVAEIKWCKTAQQSLAGRMEMLPEYKKLHYRLYRNELFLYNYSAELNFAGQYEESQSIARECERLWADYDLQMLMADNYENLQQYDKAEKYYKKAAAMCPIKFMPLYLLAKMYDTTGRRSEAIVLAEQIINKPIKISSATITAIQREMIQLIEKVNNNSLKNENTRQGEMPEQGIALPP